MCPKFVEMLNEGEIYCNSLLFELINEHKFSNRFSHRFQEPSDEAFLRRRLTLLSYESQFVFFHYLFSQTLSNGAGL